MLPRTIAIGLLAGAALAAGAIIWYQSLALQTRTPDAVTAYIDLGLIAVGLLGGLAAAAGATLGGPALSPSGRERLGRFIGALCAFAIVVFLLGLTLGGTPAIALGIAAVSATGVATMMAPPHRSS